MKWFQRTPIETARWVVIDCETSGLDIARDRLLSVGAVAVRGGRVELADCCDGRVRQDTPSAPENILIHGIGGDAQAAGQPLKEVMNQLRQFVAQGIPVAFHAPFDAGILRRHGLKLRAAWLDLATLTPALFPDRGKKEGTLDQWLATFGIPAQARHEALADAFAAAQLLLIVLAETQRQRLDTVEALFKMEGAGRWLARQP